MAGNGKSGSMTRDRRTTRISGPNWKNRTLFHGDNIDFLRAMNSETVDLVATDPPFNKNKDFHATPGSLASSARFHDRWSWERDVHQEWIDQITDDYPKLMEAIESARHAHSDSMGAFMCYMAVRLMEMHRVLKPTGALYLHCDSTACHYLKAVMDAIFDWKNFRNQIIWRRTGSIIAPTDSGRFMTSSCSMQNPTTGTPFSSCPTFGAMCPNTSKGRMIAVDTGPIRFMVLEPEKAKAENPGGA